MKLIGLGIICLLSTLASADVALEPAEEGNGLEDIPAANATDHSQPWPITAFAVVNDHIISVIRKLNWFEANEACASQGYTLAALPTEASHNRMYNAIQKSGLQKLLTEPVWTSGSNLANSDIWSWYATGDIFSFRHFRDTPPSGYRCLAFNAINGFWSADPCNAKRYFVCTC